MAAQYLEISGGISSEQELEFSALTGSLSMMSKGRQPLFFVLSVYQLSPAVLNDVLDL